MSFGRRARTLVRRAVVAVSVVALLSGFVVVGLESAASASTMISSVTFGGTQADPVVTVNGSGFGADVSVLGTPQPPPCGPYTGDSYGENFFIADNTKGTTAGHGFGAVA